MVHQIQLAWLPKLPFRRCAASWHTVRCYATLPISLMLSFYHHEGQVHVLLREAHMPLRLWQWPTRRCWATCDTMGARTQSSRWEVISSTGMYVRPLTRVSRPQLELASCSE